MGGYWSSPSVLSLLGAGPYKVGSADLMLDGSVLGDEGLFLRLYFPTDQEIKNPSDRPKWLPNIEYCHGVGDYIGTSSWVMNFQLFMFVGEKRSDCHHNAELSAKSEKWPVIVFSHGLAGNRTYYSVLCASLASHGYVVAAVEHRDLSASWTYQLSRENGELITKPLKMRMVAQHQKDEFDIRNQQVKKRVTECEKMYKLLEQLNIGEMPGEVLMGEEYNWAQFKDRLEMGKTFIVGHSFGGATALAMSGEGTKFQKAVVFDGWMLPLDLTQQTDAKLETFFLSVGNWQWKENLDVIGKVAENNEKNLMLTLKGAVHQCFSDFPSIFGFMFKRIFRVQTQSQSSDCLQAAVELAVKFLESGKEGAQKLKDEKFTKVVTNRIFSCEKYK